MDIIVNPPNSLLKPLMEKYILSEVARRWTFSILLAIQKRSLEATEVEKLHRGRYLWDLLVPDDTLHGIRDVSGIGLRWVGYSLKTLVRA